MNIAKKKESVKIFLGNSDFLIFSIFLLVTLIFVSFLYPDLIIKRDNYIEGDVATKDIKASQEILVHDKEATEEKSKQAIDTVLTVYDFDDSMSKTVISRINLAFDEIRGVIRVEKLKIKKDVASDTNTSTDSDISISTSDSISPEVEIKINTYLDIIWQLKDKFEEILGISINSSEYKILIQEEFTNQISDIIVKVLQQVFESGVVANKEILLREYERGIILRSMGSKSEKIIKNVKMLYGLDEAKERIRTIAQSLISEMKKNNGELVIEFAQKLIQPNITINRHETQERKKRAAESIKPILYKIKSGEMILREGERVTKVHTLKLSALNQQTKKEHIITTSSGTGMFLLFMFVIYYSLYIKGKPIKNQTKHLVFIATIISIIFLLTIFSASFSKALAPNLPFLISESSMFLGIPVASGSMIICLFLGLDAAIPFAVVMSVCVTFIFEKNNFIFLIYFLLSSSMAAYWIRCCRERKVFIKAGVKLAILNASLSISISLYSGNLFDIDFVWNLFFSFMGGIVSGVITSGLTPLMEIAFGYTTDIKLLELANLDQPLLKRLMIETPGTYHHSVIVGTMVEAASSDIGANPVLGRVCGYYHDIGKLSKPLYFIENQTDCKNKHDKLAPSMSSLIIINHVKYGVEIAKKDKLGKPILDAIQQHHGTSLVKYFYEKAKDLKGEDNVNNDDFRYPGPKPQTKEAGLVMLADVVEAASRTLENPTPSKIQGLVNKLINNIFSEGQLDNCELTLRDLHKIAKSFNKILSGIYHHRIEYSEKTADGKKKNESTDPQQPKQKKDTNTEAKKKSSDSLKRLGM
ncbi:MAG: HDIG domain-containing protein [Desulfobacterales bacterium]|nr:HDIG domain-containing protein [Desulfobacterales bacterium]